MESLLVTRRALSSDNSCFFLNTRSGKKVKVARTRLPSVGFRSWSRFLAVSLQVTRVINPAEGCHYFQQACGYLRKCQEGCYQFRCLVNRGTMGVNSLPKTATRQRRGCDLNPGRSAPESSMLTTWLPSHPGKPSLIRQVSPINKQNWQTKMFTSINQRFTAIIQPFTACMPLLMETSAFGLGKRRWRSPQQC